MLAPQHALDLDQGQVCGFQVRDLRGDRAQAVGADHPVARGLQRDEDLLVRVAEAAGGAFRAQHADNLELDTADLQRRADQPCRVRAEHVRDRRAEHRVALTRFVFPVREHPAGGEREVLHRDILRRRAHDVDVDVLVEALDLEVACQLGDHRLHVVGAVGQRRVVVDREVDVPHDGDAAAEVLSGIDAEQVRSHRRDAVLDGLLRARPQGQHGDHRPDADDDAQRREQGPQLVRPDRLERDLEDLVEEHRLPQRALVVPPLAPAAPPVCCRKPGSPPPVMLWKRLRMSCCAWTSEALGSSSTVSFSVKPLVTSM